MKLISPRPRQLLSLSVLAGEAASACGFDVFIILLAELAEGGVGDSRRGGLRWGLEALVSGGRSEQGARGEVPVSAEMWRPKGQDGT